MDIFGSASPEKQPARWEPKKRQCNCKNSRCLKLCAIAPLAKRAVVDGLFSRPLTLRAHDLLCRSALRRYCECFASGDYCDNCNCQSCYNNIENAAERNAAIEATLERNPNAFRPKIGQSPQKVRRTHCQLRADAPVFAGFNGGLLERRAMEGRKSTAKVATARNRNV